ncbi:MAG: helix-turn-helix domain-containing protein [Oscillospiraceae bacterium]
MRKQHYMTEQERHQLEAMRRNKIPVREIARQLGFCERTIYYELRRGELYAYLRLLGRETVLGTERTADTQLQPDGQG